MPVGILEYPPTDSVSTKGQIIRYEKRESTSKKLVEYAVIVSFQTLDGGVIETEAGRLNEIPVNTSLPIDIQISYSAKNPVAIQVGETSRRNFAIGVIIVLLGSGLVATFYFWRK